MTTTEPKVRTITMTGRAPIRIREDDWHQVAIAKHWDGEFESQANRSWTVRAREHVTDGRVIVSAVYNTRWQHEQCAAAGELLDTGRAPTSDTSGNDADVVAAIIKVCQAIGRPGLADECIADLPPQEI
jgi:hypothetical protein